MHQRLLWGAVLTAVTMATSLLAACGTPFVALATLAAIFLPRRDAILLIAVNWLANQVIGFGLLHYPLTSESVRGGIDLSVAAAASLLAARVARRALHRVASLVAVVGAFAAAFVTFEGLLFAITPWRGGGDFSPAVVLYIFYTNAIAFTGLMILQGVAQAVELVVPASHRRRLGSYRD